MLYEDYLKEPHEFPFCNLSREMILKNNSFGKIVLARAPYHKEHLLIVPNKHAMGISELSKKEKLGIFELILFAEKKLKKYHKSLSILYREGNKKDSGKSIDHMHFHIIPDDKIASISILKGNCRTIYSEKKYLNETKKAKEKIF